MPVKEDLEQIIPEIAKFEFRKSHFLLLGVIGLLLGVCVVMIAITGHNARQPLADAPYASALRDTNHYWEHQGHLYTLSYVIKNVNRSAKPCEDFYHFACGGWKSNARLGYGYIAGVKSAIVAEHNRELQEIILSKPSTENPDSYEWKMKVFFSTCLDKLGRSTDSSNTLMQEIQSAMGGWYVTDAADAWRADFNLENALSRLIIDYHLSIFFDIHPSKSSVDDTYKIQVSAVYYKSINYYSIMYGWSSGDVEGVVRQFVSETGKQFLKECNTDISSSIDERLNDFTDDVMTVWRWQKQFSIFSLLMKDMLGSGPDTYKIKDLKQHTEEIDWLTLIRNLYGDGLVISDDTEILVPAGTMDYLDKLNSFLSEVGRKKRLLNNYLVWNLLEYYGDIISHQQMLHKSLYFEGQYDNYLFDVQSRCYSELMYGFPEGMAAQYLGSSSAHKKQALNEAVDIFKEVKQSLIDTYKNVKWLNDTVKQKIVEKITGINELHAFPEDQYSTPTMDCFYQTVKFESDSSILEILIAMDQLRHRKDQILLKGQKIDGCGFNMQQQYYYIAQMTSPSYIYGRIYLPLGMLHFPFYQYPGMPSYMKLATVGSQIALQLSTLIYSDFRRIVKEDTPSKLKDIAKCITDKSVESGLYKEHQTSMTSVVYMLREVISQSAAFQAYNRWTSKRGDDPQLMQINFDNRQLYLLAEEQVDCFKYRDETMALLWTKSLNLRAVLSKNVQSAFNCQNSPFSDCLALLW